MANYQSVISEYLAKFESWTTNALESIAEVLARSGKQFDNRFKDHFIKSVKDR